ncbi:MAG: alpha-ketoglutarate-dependent dioxygenase AlkB [Planctomycetes bacterium]|nr:alpha-ketoglutarate-dependent dioxygenase AlkB [Planctomycetota bacterium]
MSTLFPQLSPGPPGFALFEDVIGRDEEARLLAWARALPLAPYVLHDTPSRRRVLSFGATYRQGSGRLGQRAVTPAPLPPALESLIGRCAPLGGIAPDAIAQALVSHYPAGAGIGWHRDRPEYGPVVVGVSLLGACRLRLRAGARPREVVTVALPPGSVYVLSGPSRASWEHAIPPVATERWSVTLRTVARAAPPGGGRSAARSGEGGSAGGRGEAPVEP